jgi:tetratricopeptide (TPR) repeat protein
MKLRLLACIAAALALPVTALAHEDAGSTKGRLGKVSFPTSCDPKVQGEFEQALAMLHSFWYGAAEKAFADLMAKDPTCSIAAWGYASILMSNPLGGVGSTPANAEKAHAALEWAHKNPAKTERERDYIDAVGAYYADWENRSERDRQVSRSKAYEALAAKYPKDDEAQIFNALYISGTQLQSEQTFASYLRAAAILEDEFKKYPDHPGVAHYLIHSYDAPPIAEKGLPAAHRYAAIAPDAPHALHMPSHIFTRVGDWEDSAATNVRSYEVAKLDDADVGEAYHASDYAVYAYLQLGRDAEAKAQMDKAMVLRTTLPSIAAPYAFASMPARYAIERRDWQAAMNIPVTETKAPFTDAITYYARALGAVRSGDVETAKKEAEGLARIHAKLEEAKNRYWATEVEVQQLTIAAWIAHKQGDGEEGLKLMRAAADLEDTHEKHIVTPARIVPARELLGEMLLEQNQPGLALTAFEASQKREPNRFRNYWDSAQAAEAMGNLRLAAGYYQRLLLLAKNADPGARPELARARTAVAMR